MINKKVEDALNAQINEELYSAYLYLSMSSYCRSIGLTGFANWMRVQYQEETFHGLKIYDYIIQRGGNPVLTKIEEPKKEWQNPLNMFEDTYKHEQHITERINNLVGISSDEKDYATVNFLQWYVSEQVEEEANATEILSQIKQAENDKSALFMIDRELKQRVFVPPVAVV